ncbi:oxygenase MpaB family protein [Allorhizocola rhizosphaerae]|uniref:oxygenase MpaB family protein n=1 Tax=Allorhizocola rhizosphaerae TaxID=1872709 RepID=UPI000E3B938B|nr:oxygenase MpaB family protein [Allorhizocola rhizosphaerae]
MDNRVSRRYVGQWRFLLAVPRATMLQAALPPVGAGVAEYSSFRPHLWRRMQNTLLSLLRIMYGEEAERTREIARLQRLHSRIVGVDERGRPYSGLDPHAQTWVLLTLFDAIVTMGALSGRPMPDDEQRQMYGEFLELARGFGIPREVVPATLEDFRRYFDRMITEELEYTQATRTVVEELIANAPRPALFDAADPLWRVVKAVLTGPGNALLRGILPSGFRQRFGLRLPWYGGLLTRGMFTAAGMASRVLPPQWTYMPYALARLALQRPSRRSPSFFTEVLDQTGNGFVALPDFLSMARSVAAEFDVDAATEAELYAAFESWWRQLAAGADTNVDGRIDYTEWAGAVRGSGAQEGLRAVLDAMFRAADTDADGAVSPQEYARLFGGKADPGTIAGTLGELDLDASGRISHAEFAAAMRSFFLDIRDNTLGRKLLAEA